MMSVTDLRFVNYATIQHDPHWATAPDIHAWHEVIAVESGGMSVRMAEETLLGQAGDIFFYRAGMMHQEHTDPQQPALTLCLSLAGAVELCDAIPPQTHDTRGRVRQLLRWVAEEMPMGLIEHPARGTGLLHAILVELGALAQPQESACVRRTIIYIHEHLRDKITLEHLADHVAMSKYHFVREYRRQTGSTPMAEVRRQRLERARTLLHSTPWPLRTIAHEVGISNEYYLSTLFRQYFGLPPGRLRNTRPRQPKSSNSLFEIV